MLAIGINRPAKRNSFTLRLIDDLALAYGLLEREADLRCGLLYGEGEHFTTGLDLTDVIDAYTQGQRPLPALPADGRDPWRLDGPWTTPIVAVAHGWCMTAGIELLLAADIRLAAADTRFTQFEVRRGIYPFGGATLRFPRPERLGQRHAVDAHRRRVRRRGGPADRARSTGRPRPGHRPRTRACHSHHHRRGRCSPGRSGHPPIGSNGGEVRRGCRCPTPAARCVHPLRNRRRQRRLHRPFSNGGQPSSPGNDAYGTSGPPSRPTRTGTPARRSAAAIGARSPACAGR